MIEHESKQTQAPSTSDLLTKAAELKKATDSRIKDLLAERDNIILNAQRRQLEISNELKALGHKATRKSPTRKAKPPESAASDKAQGKAAKA